MEPPAAPYADSDTIENVANILEKKSKKESNVEIYLNGDISDGKKSDKSKNSD